MTSKQQINSLPGLLAVKMIRQQISLTNRLTHQSATLTKGGDTLHSEWLIPLTVTSAISG